MLGYCANCDKLVPITKKPEVGYRQYGYYPVRHDTAEGRQCDGHARNVETKR